MLLQATTSPASTAVRRRSSSLAVAHGFANVIAELSEIEEIRINSVDPSGTTGGAGAGDTFNIIGDFSGTSLRLNTITIDGDAGDDTIDISALSSAHRIVFRSNGGHDTIIGTLREQDVIELPEGTTLADYEVTIDDETGMTTLVGDDYSVTFSTSGGMPQVGTDDGNDDDDDDDGEVTPPSLGSTVGGTAVADVLLGTEGVDIIRALGDDDLIDGLGGRDLLFGDAGDDVILGGGGDDMMYGDAGADRLFGGDGRDMINAGSGDDTVYGDAGDDIFVTASGDGNDTYYGDDGSDTLDMSTIGANVTVDLGTGFMMGGSAFSSLTGSDTLWGVENVVTGSRQRHHHGKFCREHHGRSRRQRHFPLPVGSRCQWRHHRRLPAWRQARPVGDRQQQRDQRQPVVHAGDRKRFHRGRPAAGHPGDARGRRIHRRRGQYVRKRHGRVPREHQGRARSLHDGLQSLDNKGGRRFGVACLLASTWSGSLTTIANHVAGMACPATCIR